MDNKQKLRMRGAVKYAYKKVGRAMADYQMLTQGDRILVAVSGGADSLAMLKLLQMRKKRIPIDFEYTACFVDAEFIQVDRQVIFDYANKNRIPLVVKKLECSLDSIDCFWCSWNRRKVLFTTAREYHCNKLALGHHMDDIAETILMNIFYRAEVSAMKPSLSVFGGDISIIRPLSYLTKNEIYAFITQMQIPHTHYACQHGEHSRRKAVKDIIAVIEKDCPYVKKNIFNALKNIKEEYLV